jgi:hypothetical protein
MQPSEVLVRLVHRAGALDGICEPIAVPARKEPPATIELFDPTATKHAI